MSLINRRILIQVTMPAIILGLLLLAACVGGAWYANRLQKNLAILRTQSVNNLRQAQGLEFYVGQLRFHVFRYLIDPTEENLASINRDHDRFERALGSLKDSVRTDEEVELVEKIERDYRIYHGELDQLRNKVGLAGQPMALRLLDKNHPIRPVVDSCEKLLGISDARMTETFTESDRVSGIARWTMILLGIGGPLSGLLCGYGIARGLSRSIYQLSVRVQDMAQRLDQDVASVSVTADGDLGHLDRQLQQVVQRVEEVAERVQRQQRDLLRTEQLSAVGQLAASVAHEVRNPLTSVKLLVESALNSKNRKPLSEQDLQVIHAEVVRLEQTVQSFLDFARLPTPRRSIVDLREVVNQAVELVRARARQQQVEIEPPLGDQLVSADVDRGQFCTVLVNLFLNALDAMPNGGKLRINLETSPLTGIDLMVSDTGFGIAEDVAAKLFTPFVSGKATGTGLGLSLSKRIVEEHGGRIEGGNLPRGGAGFRISLPANALHHRQAV